MRVWKKSNIIIIIRYFLVWTQKQWDFTRADGILRDEVSCRQSVKKKKYVIFEDTSRASFEDIMSFFHRKTIKTLFFYMYFPIFPTGVRVISSDFPASSACCREHVRDR